MSNALGINLGRVYGQAESIKTARLQREGLEREAETEKNALGLRQRAVAGDRGAFMELAALDPEGARSLKATLDALTPKARAAKKQEIEGIGDAAAFILNAENPEEAYATVLASLPEEARAALPPTFNQSYVELQLVRALGADDYLDRLDKQREANTPGAPEPLGSSESNAIWRQVAALYGGLYDPNTGEVTGLSGSEAKVNEVAALAEEIMLRDGKSVAQAVQEANRRVGGSGGGPDPVIPSTGLPDLPGGFVLD